MTQPSTACINPKRNRRPPASAARNAARSSRALASSNPRSASAGGGAQIDLASETAHDPDSQWVFPCQWLAKLGRRQTAALRMISISGDSMVPLLEHDDTVMLDCSQTRPSPPGIFILDDGVGLVAKRIEIIPNTTPQMLRISSENSAYSSYQRRIDEVHIIGRVIWFARRL